MLITPTPRWLGYAWCVWSWRLMHDNLFVYWSVCDVTILRSSFHADNSNAKMVVLCLMRMIKKVDTWYSFRLLIGVWFKKILTGRLIAPNRSFAQKLSLYHSIKRVTASVYNCSCRICNESKTKVPSSCDFVIESLGFCTLWRVYECHTRLDYYFARWLEALVFNNTEP